MIINRYIFLIPVLATTLLFSATFNLAAQDIRFNWALLVDTDTGLAALNFDSPPLVTDNNTLQLYLHPDKSTFIYIFLLDSSNYFTPIFPTMGNYYDRYPPGGPIHIPTGEDRFTTLPPAGQEKFYLIASAKRLKSVEKLLKESLNYPDDVNLQAKLFEEVRYLRRKHSKMTQYTEKGMPVSGTMRSLNQTRGTAKESTFVATHVEASGFYSRILRLNHE